MVKLLQFRKKIKEIVHDLHDYQGVIAISYTNKASKELFDRVSKSGTDVKTFVFWYDFVVLFKRNYL